MHPRIVVRFLNSDLPATASAMMGAMALASLSRPLCVASLDQPEK